MIVHTITMDFQWAAIRWGQSLCPWTGDAHLGAHASPPRTCLRYGMRFAPRQSALWFVWEIRRVAPLWVGLHLNSWVWAAVRTPEVVVPGGVAPNGRTLLSIRLELITKQIQDISNNQFLSWIILQTRTTAYRYLLKVKKIYSFHQHVLKWVKRAGC